MLCRMNPPTITLICPWGRLLANRGKTRCLENFEENSQSCNLLRVSWTWIVLQASRVTDNQRYRHAVNLEIVLLCTL